MRRQHRRSAFTLLEVLLALVIAVLLLIAVYSVIGYQLTAVQTGRSVIERTTLSRSLANRMTMDIHAAVALCDAARYRRPQALLAQLNTVLSALTAPETGSGTGSGSGSGSGSGAPTGESGATGSDMPSTPAPSTEPVTLPLGVLGTSEQLHLYITRVPTESFSSPSAVESNMLTSDLRRVTYWLSDQGLCRYEARTITSEEGLNPTIPSDTTKSIMAEEVASLEFSYFDGNAWTDSWDSTQLGADTKTPMGSPRAIAIRMGVRQPGVKNDTSEPRIYRFVVPIHTANGAPQIPPMTQEDPAQAGGGTTSTTTP
jgi:prepilin-type N-terminal cleavage/methylation domain-containing protein